MAFIRQFDDYLYEMEVKHYNFPATRQWARDVTPYVVLLAFSYVGLAHLGVHWMKDRAKYDLRRPLVMWNAGLGWFSIFASWRIAPYLVKCMLTGRWADLVCSLDSFQAEEGGLWAFIFTGSKLVEFGDTVFVVLKKKKLTFLHWYHHLTVCLYCWFNYADPTSLGKVFGVLNVMVHALMYTYYTATAAGLWKIPRSINVFITTVQLLQMVVGIVATTIGFYRYKYNYGCGVTDLQLWCAFIMYGSYLILFINFFYQTYMRRKSSSAAAAPASETKPKVNGH